MNMTHGGQNKYRENREYFKRKTTHISRRKWLVNNGKCNLRVEVEPQVGLEPTTF